jgi:hypothetical protein
MMPTHDNLHVGAPCGWRTQVQHAHSAVADALHFGAQTRYGRSAVLGRSEFTRTQMQPGRATPQVGNSQVCWMGFIE